MSHCQCSALIGKGYYQTPCPKKARFEHENKMYCGMHHPPSAEERKIEQRRMKELFAQQNKERVRESFRKAKRFDALLEAFERVASQANGELRIFALAAIEKAKL